MDRTEEERGGWRSDLKAQEGRHENRDSQSTGLNWL